MDAKDIERVDRLTGTIYRLLNGQSASLIDIEDQGDSELAQLSGFINKLILEQQMISTAIEDLGDGSLSTPITSKLPVANFVKKLQATLKHLTWQAEQIAHGDFSQRVSFLGEFSKSFNWMIQELARSKDELEEKVKNRTHQLSQLLDASARLSGSRDLDFILEEAAKVLLHSFAHHTSCRIGILSPEGNSFWIKKAVHIRHTITVDVNHEYRLAELPFLNSVLENNECRIVDSESTDMLESEKLFILGEEYKTTLAIAISDGNKPLGLVLLSESRSKSRSKFAEDELGFYRTLANELNLAIHNALLFKKNRDNFVNTIEALAASIDARDAYTHFHSKNVTYYSIKIAEAMYFSTEKIERLSMACLLHDIGKIGIADSVLLKPGKLTPDETEIIRSHPEKAAIILSSVAELAPVSDIILAHHERFDGKGYPQKLAGSAIPLESRIIAVADAFDAMTTNRVYRPSMTSQQALEEIKRCSESQFDPEIAQIFIRISDSLENKGLS